MPVRGGTTLFNWGDVGAAFGNDWFALLPDVALTAFVTVLVGLTAFGLAVGRAMAGWNGGGLFNPAKIPVPSDLQSVVVLTADTVVLGSLGLSLFLRRDVRGAQRS
jgi:hypothetical protein